MKYEISTETSRNDEGSDFATVTITFENGEVVTEHFARYFDSGPIESAVVQAASYVAAFEKAEERLAEAERLGVHPLELAFAPFGSEYQREMEEERCR